MKTPRSTTIRIPGILKAYRDRLAAPDEDITEPLQLWLPCVSGGQDTAQQQPAPKTRNTRID